MIRFIYLVFQKHPEGEGTLVAAFENDADATDYVGQRKKFATYEIREEQLR